MSALESSCPSCAGPGRLPHRTKQGSFPNSLPSQRGTTGFVVERLSGGADTRDAPVAIAVARCEAAGG